MRKEKTHVARPVLRLRGELAGLEVEDGEIVHVTDDDELKSVDGSTELENREERCEREEERRKAEE